MKKIEDKHELERLLTELSAGITKAGCGNLAWDVTPEDGTTGELRMVFPISYQSLFGALEVGEESRIYAVFYEDGSAEVSLNSKSGTRQVAKGDWAEGFSALVENIVGVLRAEQGMARETLGGIEKGLIALPEFAAATLHEWQPLGPRN